MSKRILVVEDQEDNRQIPWIECMISPFNFGIFTHFTF